MKFGQHLVLINKNIYKNGYWFNSKGVYYFQSMIIEMLGIIDLYLGSKLYIVTKESVFIYDTKTRLKLSTIEKIGKAVVVLDQIFMIQPHQVLIDGFIIDVKNIKSIFNVSDRVILLGDMFYELIKNDIIPLNSNLSTAHITLVIGMDSNRFGFITDELNELINNQIVKKESVNVTMKPMIIDETKQRHSVSLFQQDSILSSLKNISTPQRIIESQLFTVCQLLDKGIIQIFEEKIPIGYNRVVFEYSMAVIFNCFKNTVLLLHFDEKKTVSSKITIKEDYYPLSVQVHMDKLSVLEGKRSNFSILGYNKSNMATYDLQITEYPFYTKSLVNESSSNLEIQGRLLAIEKRQDAIEKKLDKILDKLMI